MKPWKLWTVCAVILSVMAAPCASRALSIEEKVRADSYGGLVKGVSRPSYVICNNCVEYRPLAVTPRNPLISVQLSQEQSNIDKGKGDDIRPASNQSRVTSRPKNLSIHFGLNSSKIQPTDEAKLSAFLKDAKEMLSNVDSDKKVIAVEGYTCDLGSKRVNDILAKKRAEVVAQRMERMGLKPTSVIGKGKCCYVTEERSQISLNRRAEITIQMR